MTVGRAAGTYIGPADGGEALLAVDVADPVQARLQVLVLGGSALVVETIETDEGQEQRSDSLAIESSLNRTIVGEGEC